MILLGDCFVSTSCSWASRILVDGVESKNARGPGPSGKIQELMAKWENTTVEGHVGKCSNQGTDREKQGSGAKNNRNSSVGGSGVGGYVLK